MSRTFKKQQSLSISKQSYADDWFRPSVFLFRIATASSSICPFVWGSHRGSLGSTLSQSIKGKARTPRPLDEICPIRAVVLCMGVPIPHPPFWHCPTEAVWLSKVNDVSAFAGRRRRAGFPFSERVSGGIVNMEPEMEDKTLELMVRYFVGRHHRHEKWSVSLLNWTRRRGSIRRQEWAEAACRERERRKEGGLESRGRAWIYRYILGKNHRSGRFVELFSIVSIR